MKANGTPLIDRELLLKQAQLLIQSDNFDHQANARANALMTLADRLAPGSANPQNTELRDYSRALRGSIEPGGNLEWRDLGATSGTGAFLIPQAFRNVLETCLKEYDAIFNENVTTRLETTSGAPMMVPVIDDTSSQASVVGEAQQTTLQDPNPGASQVQLPSAPTWRSGMVKVSRELWLDAFFDPATFLAAAFAVRFARGLGSSLITTLLAGAKLGTTASGDPNGSGTNGSNSVGYGDLVQLRLAVNPSYRASSKCWWLMSDDTLAAIDSLTDKNGRPLIHPVFDPEGNRMLMGYRVGLCPSLPSIAAGATPILFGATGYFLLRWVPSAMAMRPLTERFADYFQVAFQSYLRAQGTLLCAAGSDSPVKYLQNAA